VADGLQTYSTNAVLTSSSLSKVARRVVIDCTSATRPGSPLEGMHIYETDTQMLRRYNGSAWITYPNGIIAHATTNNNVAITTSTVYAQDNSGNDLELTFDRVNGEMYLFSAHFSVQASSAGDMYVYQPELDIGSGYNPFDVQRVVEIATNAEFPFGCSVRAMHTAGGSSTAKFRLGIARASGVGFGVIIDGSDFCVEHCGNFA